MKKSARMVLAVILFTIAANQGIASADQSGKHDYLKASAEDMKWWRDAKFGLFIHWGPVSLTGKEIGWGRGGRRPFANNIHVGPGAVPAEEYDNLYKRFNPTKFNAKQWVALAKAAGMKYLVFTTKHHDGFCMFDSKLTDYKITNSPFKRDIVAELAKACHEGGLPLGFYYSQPDWHHPDCKTDNHANYIRYFHGHLRELCSNYGKVNIIWFDGLRGKAEDWDAKNLFKMIRQLQPHVLINNRAGLPADFGTPEQRVGGYQTDHAWESCITIGTQWAYKPDDKIKSLKVCLHTLIKCVGRGGNLLFNVGPMSTGEIEPRQAERLKKMGQWLNRFGESIYGTRAGLFHSDRWGVSTVKGDAIYLHILDWKGLEGAISLPAIDKKILSSSLLTGGKVLVQQGDEEITISVPQQYRQEIDTIVALKIDGQAADCKLIVPVSQSN